MDSFVLVLDDSLMNYLVRKGLSIEDISLLCLLGRQRVDLLESYLRKGTTNEQRWAMLQSLVRKRLLELKTSDTFKLEDYEITEVGRTVLTDVGPATSALEVVTGISIPTSDRTVLDTFVDKYLELFPKGVKNGGNKPLRSNVTDVKAKMLKFMNKYHHPQETILTATGNYINRLRGTYTYCPTAEYFIMKDGSSALATECDMVKSGLSDGGELIDPFQKRM